MNFFRELPLHARVVGGALFCLLALILLVATSLSVGWYIDNTRKLEELEPLIARLRGLSQSTGQLAQSNQTASNQLTELTYPSSVDTTSAGAQVQQRLRQYLEHAGMEVAGSQVLNATTQQGFEEIRVDISATGSVEALQEALQAIQSARPLLLIESLELSPARQRRGDQTQTIVLRLSLQTMRSQS